MVVERRSWDGKGRREKEREKGREGASVAVEIEILQERHCKAASIDKHPNLWQARLHVHSSLAITHDSPLAHYWSLLSHEHFTTTCRP